MSNTIKDLRREFERLSELAALDIYPDYPKIESVDRNKSKQKNGNDDTNSVSISYSEFEKNNGSLFDDTDDNTCSLTIDKDYEIQALQTKLKRKEIIIENLESQLDQLKYGQDQENEEMRESLNELEIILADNKQTRKELVSENKTLQRQIEHLEQELDDTKSEIIKLKDTMNQNVSSHEKKESEFHFEIQKAKNQIISLQNELKMINESNNELKESNNGLRKYSRDMEQELNDITRQLRSSKSQIESFQTAERQSNVARKSVISQLSLYKKQNDILHKELKSKEKNVEKLNKMNDSLTKKSRMSTMMLEKAQTDQEIFYNDLNDLYDMLLTLKQRMEIAPEQFQLAVDSNPEQRSQTFTQSIKLFNDIVTFFNQKMQQISTLNKQVAALKKREWNKEETMESMKKLEENVQKYRQFIETLSNNFSIYHDLIEQKFSNLVGCQSEMNKYKEMIITIKRESQEIQSTQIEEFGKEIEKYKQDIDKLKDVEREYQHLAIEHKHLSSKYHNVLSKSRKASTQNRSRSNTISIDHETRSMDDSLKLKDEIENLKKTVNKWQYKWDKLRQTPARHYIDDIDQKFRFSVDERNEWKRPLGF